MGPSELRRAPRFKATLRVQIIGVDTASVVRRGDLSASGIFIDIDREIGPLGSMQRLLLQEENGKNAVTVLAQVVRVATVEDFWKGRSIAGVALQFLFEEEVAGAGRAPTSRPAAESERLAQLIRALMEQAARQGGVPVQGWRGNVDAGAGRSAAALQDLDVRGLVLETERAVEKGRSIRIELPGATDEETLTLEGRVVDCTPDEGAPGRFRARVAFAATTPEDDDSEPPPSGMGETMGAAFSSLLEAVSHARVPAVKPGGKKHLAGELARVSLVSVLTLCQLEQVTGVLTLEDGAQRRVRVFLRQGDVVDVEGDPAGARAALGAALGFTSGTFAVEFTAVDRPRRIAESTTALVLDLAREHDERRSKR